MIAERTLGRSFPLPPRRAPSSLAPTLPPRPRFVPPTSTLTNAAASMGPCIRPVSMSTRAQVGDPLFRWQRQGRWAARGWLFGALALGLHVALVGAVVLGGKSTESYAADRDLIDVSVEPALGVPQGSLEGRGLGSHVEATAPSPRQVSHRSAASKPSHTDLDGPASQPSGPAVPAASTQPASEPRGPDSAQPAAVPSGDPATPAGSANAAPAVGRPDGTENGAGTQAPKPRMTPGYAGQLAGWFGSRFNVRGLGLDPEELKKLSVGVSISVSPDRHITGFSLRGSSGNAAYDDEVRRTVAGIQASGVPLPEPSDGSTPPATFSVRFRPLVIR